MTSDQDVTTCVVGASLFPHQSAFQYCNKTPEVDQCIRKEDSFANMAWETSVQGQMVRCHGEGVEEAA